MARVTSKDLSVVAYDAAGNSIVLGPGEGDFSFPGLEEGGTETIEARDRGKHDGWFRGPDKTIEWSGTLQVPATNPNRVGEWFLRQGDFTGLESLDPDDEVFTHNLEVLRNGTPIVHAKNSRTMIDWSESGADGSVTFSLSGRAAGGAGLGGL